jgi:hypothetical protein
VSPSDHIFQRCYIMHIRKQEIGYTAQRHSLEDSTPTEPQRSELHVVLGCGAV